MSITKSKQTERKILEQWLEDNNRYEFLIFPNGWEPIVKLRKAKQATKAMDVILEKAARKVQELAKRFRSMGIGDTDTDEAIVAEFYTILHSL